MATQKFSGHSGYQLEATASRSGSTITISRVVRRTSTYTAWSTASQSESTTIGGQAQNGTWTYDFRNTTVKVLPARSRSGLGIGTVSWSTTVSMASGIGSATVSGTISIPPDAPAAPTIGSVTRNSDTSHTVTWTRNATSTAPYYSQGLQRREWVNGAWGTWQNVNINDTDYTNSGSHSFTDTTTKANRVYEWRVFGYNSSGTATSGGTSSVYTTPGVPAVGLEAVSSTQVRATLTQTAEANNYKTELQYSSGGGAWTALTTLTSGSTYTWTPPAAASIRVRARTIIDKSGSVGHGLASDYGYSNTVPLQQPPLAPSNLSPNGVALDKALPVKMSWKHNSQDTSAQTAYEIQTKAYGGAWTSQGKVTSSASSRTFTAGTFGYDPYEWRVRTWGVHANPGPYSSPASFELFNKPTVTITSPSGVAESSRVTVQWNTSQSQAQWEAELLHDSDIMEVRSGSGSTSSVLFNPLLTDGESYQVRVRAQASTGLWSDWSEAFFNADFPAPAAPAVSLGWDPERGAVLVSIDNPATPFNEEAGPSFEITPSGWAPVGATAVQYSNTSSTWTNNLPYTSGSWMVVVTSTGVANYVRLLSDHQSPIAPGQRAGLMAVVASESLLTVRGVIRFYDSSNSQIESRTSPLVLANFYSGTLIEMNEIAPPGTSYWRAEFQQYSGTVDPVPTGKRMWVEGVRRVRSWSTEETAAMLAQGYADGDTPGWKWDGTPHASTSRMANATSNEVYRSYDGENWELVATDVPLGSTIADPEVVLNTEVFYRVNAVSDLGTVGTADSVSTFTESKVGYWAVGEGFFLSQQLRMDLGQPPGIDLETGLATKELHYFAGRTLPVEYAGKALTRSGEASFMVGSVAERNQVLEMSTLPAPHLFRLPDGTFLYASIEPVSTHREDEGFYTVQVPLTEVER